MEISLRHLQWHLKGFWPYVPFLGQSIELGNSLMGITDWVPAVVPGGVHRDLLRAGLIEDPYFELNSLKCEWVENRWWMYKVGIPIAEEWKGKRLTLLFKGVDYKAHFFLNGKKLGVHEGMYEGVQFPVEDKVNYDEENELTVLFESAPQEMSQVGYTSLSSTQKSRFNYKWDFGTRLVNIGLWDDVALKITGHYRFESFHITTDVVNGTGSVKAMCEITGPARSDCGLRYGVYLGEKVLHSGEEIFHLGQEIQCWEKEFEIQEPLLWYPNGYGEQPLYEVRVEILEQGSVSDEMTFQTGIRRMEYRRNEGSSPDSMPYTLVINHQPIYIKGVNITPLDHLYGNVGEVEYTRLISAVKKANVNLVRLWGGGIIEKEYFYHLCDCHGILVWQEFIQSSSGIDNEPSCRPEFMNLLKASAVAAIKNRRSHVCHAVWCGGNELMDAQWIPVTLEHLNIDMLHQQVKMYDPDKLFLPSSASGPRQWLNLEQPGTNHDIHGGWKYEGEEKHYRTYNSSDSLLHSEFGVDGLSSLESLEKCLGQAHLKVTGVADDLVWRHHGEWWDTLERDSRLFGKPSSLQSFIQASQFVQAEGLRYIIESNRRRKFKNSGSILWQFNEPWPNVSCTCIMEYHGVPKMAYYWVRQAFEPVHASLMYERLRWEPYEEFVGEIHVHNSLGEQKLRVSYEILDSSGAVLGSGGESLEITMNTVVNAGRIAYRLPPVKNEIFFVRLRLFTLQEEACCENLYVFSQRKEEIFRPLQQMPAEDIVIDKQETGFRIKNQGKTVCLFIHGFDPSGRGGLFIDNNYTSLFPGEERTFTIESFNTNWHYDGKEPAIRWRYFNQK